MKLVVQASYFGYFKYLTLTTQWADSADDTGLSGTVGCTSIGDQEVAGLTPAGSATFFCEDLIMKLALIQEWHLSVSGERMCKILVNCLEDCLPSKSVVR